MALKVVDVAGLLDVPNGDNTRVSERSGGLHSLVASSGTKDNSVWMPLDAGHAG
jgi:hypothetical protein